MAATSQPGLFGNENAYPGLRAVALGTKPQAPLRPGELYIAVLQLNSPPVSEGFLWFRVKAKHTIAKLKKAYSSKANVDVAFKFAGETMSNATPMRNLDHLNDNTIVFTAHEETMSSPQAMLSGVSSTPVRMPLQQINNRFPSTPNSVASEGRIKNEPATNVSPFAGVEPGNVSRVKNESTFSGELAQYPIASPQIAWPQAAASSSAARCETRKPEPSMPNMMNEDLPEPGLSSKQNLQIQRIHRIIDSSSPDDLEVEVKSNKKFLANLKEPLMTAPAENRDAQHWLQQIETLYKQQVDTPTIIGVVGNTGAGKSSIINAMLDEERLVPTNCMRACTAVVTEMSWNYSNNRNEKYRAEIEFIQASDWRKDLEISLKELLDNNGNVSRDCSNPESEAGIAYAKIKAVYPHKTKEDIATSSVDRLMNEAGVKNVLGQTRKIAKADSDAFYRALQGFVDSKEKNKRGDKKEKRDMEFWPLIKVVKIYVKADALSTGAVIVDLPGVHDSNAARAAVASGYMKKCTGLFIVAPINRAVDDKAAKSLLGESFKRQLKFDGIYSRITFICSKTDDISITEAADSLNLDFDGDWQKIDDFNKKKESMETRIQDLKDSKAVYQEIINDCDDAIENWEKLRDQVGRGETVFAPSKSSNKRKRSSSSPKAQKRAQRIRLASDSDDDDDLIDDDNEGKDSDAEGDVESDDDMSTENGDALTEDEIEKKISELKDTKKQSRRERNEIDSQVRSLNQELNGIVAKKAEIDTGMNAMCIEGRNNYSKTAIQRDFADGIRELDQETAQEEDPDQFDPDQQLRDYDEVSKSLPVFCVSSRAYQKLCGRLVRDKAVPGFRNVEETEVPQLQAHCRMLTEASRASNCRAYLSSVCQLLNSLSLWALNDGTDLNMTDAQLATETRYLKTRLVTLERGLEGAISATLKDMNSTLAENIFERYPQLVEIAIQEANSTVNKWHAPVNKCDRAAGGYYWSTYKAIVRREGVYSNAQGPHDLNLQLIEPIIKQLAGHWEKTFAQKMPRVLQSFTRLAKALLHTFHTDVEHRSIKAGTGSAGLAMLGQSLRVYDALFGTFSERMMELINTIQREANRQFTPVIARNLATAYDWCAAETGPGQYQRMKNHMSSHVETARKNMFAESCDEVRARLRDMCREVEEAMSTHADEVFLTMQRDYMEVIAGRQIPESGMMPKWERKMRADVAKVIDDRDKTADQDALDMAEEASKDAARAVMDETKRAGRAAKGAKEREAKEATEVDAAIKASHKAALRQAQSAAEQSKRSGVLPAEIASQLINLEEPKRTSHWIQCLFEEAPGENIAQTTVWKTYEACFKPFEAESGIKILAFGKFSGAVGATFEDRVTVQMLSDPDRIVFDGMKYRSQPFGLDGKPY